MGEKVDAIIIGAGVIGAATAFELSKRGYKTLNIDKLPSASYGPTSNSCAIVRAHYSSLDGVAMAYEGLQVLGGLGRRIWRPPTRADSAKYMQCGTILLKSSTAHHHKVLPHYDALGVTYEDWDTETTKQRMPIFDMHEFWPPTRPSEDPDFTAPRGGELPGAIFTPESGYVSDPALASHNLQRAAEAKGGRFEFRTKVTAIRRENGRVAGVTLEDGTDIDARIVVNVAGPHSFVINRMAGVEDGMNIKTKALRHEVHHVPAPEDFDYDHDGRARLRRRQRHLLPARDRQQHPDRLGGSRLRPAGVDREPRRLQPVNHPRAVGSAGVPLRPADPVAADPARDEGRGRSVRLLRRLDPAV